MPDATMLLAYAVPGLPIWAAYALNRFSRQTRDLALLDDSENAGLTEPPSLHPVVDPMRCIGCGACARACPEGDVLGVVAGKATLVDPTRCIGHGACQTACPTDAIELVFGTETRGIDIPTVSPDFETNIDGLFIAGELGGMGLIRNAVEQGREAVAAIAARLKTSTVAADLDLVIVGAGPAGIAASLAAKEAGLKAMTIEQDSLGGTVAHYPRAKIAMTQPFTLPLHGRITDREISKEALIELWTDVVARHRVPIEYGVRVDGVERDGGAFIVRTDAQAYHARHVLLAIGRRGTPRTLGVEGEDQAKVVYRLVDPEQYRGRSMLVVGGGDSAVEAALALAEQRDTDVILAHRGERFDRVRKLNRERLEAARVEGSLTVLTKAVVTRMGERWAGLSVDGKSLDVRNDGVIVCAGGVLPSMFLQRIGVEVKTKHGVA